MHFSKKIIAVVTVGILLFVASFVQIYALNKNFANPENIPLEKSETSFYKGLKITPTDLCIYTWDELNEKYPAWAECYIFQNTFESIEDESEDKGGKDINFILCKVEVENDTEYEIELVKDKFLYWIIEAGYVVNGMDPMTYEALNDEETCRFNPGDVKTVYLPYQIWKEDLPTDELKKTDIKIVYSYYPTKNYLFFKSDGR